MTIRTKLMLVLATVIALVAANGLIDAHYESITRTEIDQLGKIAIAGSDATHDLLDTLAKLEASLSLNEDWEGRPTNSVQICKQGENLFRQFHKQFGAASRALLVTNILARSKNPAPLDLRVEQLSLLNGIGSTLNDIELQWHDFTNCLPAWPRRAESIREERLLPVINNILRPALSRYDRFLEEQTDRQVEHILGQVQRSKQIMLIIELGMALGVLAASLFLGKTILDPLKKFADTASEVAAGNRQCRLHLKRTDELGAMALAFNNMLDVLQATTISRDELERNVRERTEELEKEVKARHAANAELDRFFALSRDALSIGNFSGDLLRINPAFADLFGYSFDESYPLPAKKGVHPDDIPMLETKWRALTDGAPAVDFEIRTRARDGTWRILAWKAVSAPELKLIYGSARDVTELRRAAEALRKSEQNLSITLNSIGDGVLVTDAAGRIMRLNPVAEQLTGWKQVEAAGRPVNEIFRIFDEVTRQPVTSPIIEVVARDKSLSLSRHTILLHRNGAEHPIADSCAPIRDEENHVIGVVLVFRDVSEERWAQEQIVNLNLSLENRVEERTAELRESERRHRTLLANLQGMAYRCRNDRDWTMEFMSEGCRNLLGLDPDAFTSGKTSYNDLIHPDDQEMVWQQVQTAIRNRTAFAIEYRVKHADGIWRSVWEQGRAVFDDHGQVSALEGYISDITQRFEAERTRRALEDQLRQAQKLEAVGTLAGGIAHDFNNILAAILGSAELIKMDLAPDHPARECLDQIFVAGSRARELVQQILMFSRRRESERSVAYLQPVVKECLKLLRSTIPAMVEIKHRIDSDCAPVLADLTQIHQVIMNLCTNSWQALPERGGRISVELKMCQMDEDAATLHPDLRAGSYVQLCVLDNGCGMDKAILERIFEPFFTTKPAGKGSGLGLSVVHGILKHHKGAITVDSEPGKGTAFYIYLPAQSVPQAKGPEPTSLTSLGNGERILLVDDEEVPGRTMEQILKRLRYSVERFSHPKDALDRFRGARDKFDLVISDLAMPLMSGMDFAAAVRQIRSDVPILVTTGMIDSATEEQASKIKIHKVLLKPVTSEILGGEIAQILAEEGRI